MFWGVVRRVVRGAAVANTDVQVAIGSSERKHSAVVIGVGRMRNSQDDRLSRVGDIGIDRRNLEFGDHESAGWNGGISDVRVEDEEPAVGRVVRMKSQTEKTLLAAALGQGTSHCEP